QYLWRDASGKALSRDEVASLIGAVDRRLADRAADLDFNNVTAKKMADRAVPVDRDVLEGDVYQEASQLMALDDIPLRDRRPMGSVLDQGVELHIAPEHVQFLKEIADQQAKGFVPTGFREVVDEGAGRIEYEAQGWRAASAEEMDLP